MKKLFIVWIFALVILSISFVLAKGEGNFAAAEEIIRQKISCDVITEDQLELIGDYFMEQMHPGKLHDIMDEIMDERMGGEGSETLRQVHISMARSFYCGEPGIMPSGMMNAMMGRNGFGMMMGINQIGGMNMMQGYYGGYGSYGMNLFGWVFMLLLIVALILLIIWLYKQIQKK